MLGTSILEVSLSEIRHQKACTFTRLLRQMGKDYRKKHCGYSVLKYHAKDRRALERCLELSKSFRLVKIDESFKAKLKTPDGSTIIAPLVFSVNLPVKSITKRRVSGQNGKDYELKAQTPLPTKEGLEAIRTHKNKFDKLALWWVPNDIVIEEVAKEVDPIIVGKIETSMYGDICFELHRWVDDNFEAEYWAREAY